MPVQKVVAKLGLMPKLFWVENNYDMIAGTCQLLEKKHSPPIHVEVFRSVSEIDSYFEKHSASPLIVDIQLDGRRDGLAFARQQKNQIPFLPISIVSSYIDSYKKRIETLEGIKCIDREDLADPIINNEFRNEFGAYTCAIELYRYFNLNKMTWRALENHEYNEDLLDAHSILFSDYARRLMFSRGYSWVAFAGGQVYKRGFSMNSFPDIDTKLKWAKDSGRAPLVYAVPMICEESGIQDMLLNHYPRTGLLVDNEYAEVTLDTGSNRTVISEVITGKEPNTPYYDDYIHGHKYRSNVGKRNIAWVSMYDGEVSSEISLPVMIVKDWKGSGWEKYCPGREGLLGRDYLSNVMGDHNLLVCHVDGLSIAEIIEHEVETEEQQ